MTTESKPEIKAWFVIRETPYGSAPERIKEQWVDIPLPLRSIGDVETPNITIGHDLGDMFSVVVRESASVVTADATKALRLFGRDEAAEFWESALHPEEILNFGVDEGQFYPPTSMQQEMPGIELFDQN